MAKSSKNAKPANVITKPSKKKLKNKKSNLKIVGSQSETKLSEALSIAISKSPAKVSDVDPDLDSDISPEEMRKVLEPLSKSEIIDLICSPLPKGISLTSRLRELSDRDPAHRNVFVHGLAWDAKRETVISAFEKYGEIEECNVVVNKATGRSKGYAFVLFKTRKGAREALKEPQKQILNRTAWCQLASVGPVAGKKTSATTGPAKINLAQNIPTPRQSWDHSKNSGQDQQSYLGQNLAILGQNPALNPLFGGLLGNPIMINPLLAGALEQGLVNQGLVPMSMAGVGGQGGADGQSMLHPNVLSAFLPNQFNSLPIGSISDPRGLAGSESLYRHP